jgi:hypothetical protein
MSEKEHQSSGTDGRLVKRFKYPDGRLTALVTVDNDWQVLVFASEEAAEKFAKHFNLEVTEIEDGNSGSGG